MSACWGSVRVWAYELHVVRAIAKYPDRGKGRGLVQGVRISYKRGYCVGLLSADSRSAPYSHR
jgi:hypothetical protein